MQRVVTNQFTLKPPLQCAAANQSSFDTLPQGAAVNQNKNINH